MLSVLRGTLIEGPGPVPTEGLRRGMTLEKIARTLVGRERRGLDSRKDNESVLAFPMPGSAGAEGKISESGKADELLAALAANPRVLRIDVISVVLADAR